LLIGATRIIKLEEVLSSLEKYTCAVRLGCIYDLLVQANTSRWSNTSANRQNNFVPELFAFPVGLRGEGE
jgi:hypothetical protein